MKQTQISPSDKKTEETLDETEAKAKADRDAMLDEIDTVLEGIDETLATNFIQKGGE